LILLVLLIFFIGKSLGLIVVQNWWAIIFWIPAISSFGNVLKEIRQRKVYSFSLISGISGIIFPIVISIGFFIGKNWILYAPIFIIISGLILFQTGFIDSTEPVGKFLANVRPWVFSIGLAVSVIGTIFLFPAIKPDLHLDQIMHWFGLALIICSFGGFYSLFQRNKTKNASILSIFTNLLFSMIFLFMGAFVLLQRTLNIGGGIIFFVLFIILVFLLIKKKPIE